MQQTVQVLHYPTLKTVLAVEKVLKDSKQQLSRYAIMKRLKNKIMLQTLNVVIDYLEEHGMVFVSNKGIVWTYTPTDELLQRMKNGLEV